MRTSFIEISLKIPVPIDKPDLNNVFYKEEVIKDACKNTSDLPIIIYCSNDETKIIGIANNIEYKSGYILVDGYLRYGGTEETVEFDNDKKIVSMAIQSIGISD